ncbi:hypothetical protein L6452_45210 [Arctium lappa]|nr:hypothetical protein L6452_45210 [Arctium lappa]
MGLVSRLLQVRLTSSSSSPGRFSFSTDSRLKLARVRLHQIDFSISPIRLPHSFKQMKELASRSGFLTPGLVRLSMY